MANAVVTVLEADGTTETDVTILDVGRQAAAASKSVAMSTEDKAVFDLQATAAKQDTIIGHLDGVEGSLTTIAGKDFATQTTLASLLAKVIAAPATEAKQDSAATLLTAIETAIDDLTTVVESGDAEHDAADGSTIPAKIGFRAKAGMSGVTLVAADDRSNAYGGLDGALYVRPHCGLEDIVSGNANNTDGSSTSVITAAGAGIKQYLTSVVLTNTSSSNIYVEMKSGTTVKATIPLPANSGAIFNPPVPLPPNAANEAWNFDPSAATTTVYCTAVGFKSKV